MKLLVLGGTMFLGRAVVDAALADGHEVTIFNRGRTNPELFPEVERLDGDRDGDLGALARPRVGRRRRPRAAYVPRVYAPSAELLRDAVGHYVFVSTISVYADPTVPIDESSPVPSSRDPASRGRRGGRTARSRSAASAPSRTSSASAARSFAPGLIVGPHDPTDRFTYWPRRLAEGGDVLAPGDPRQPVQFVDARDLGAFLVRARRARSRGVFNATGPAEPLTLGELLDGRTPHRAGARLVWVDEQRLLDAGVQPWMELPLWLPGRRVRRDARAPTSRARSPPGSRFRPLEETARDTLAWSREAGEQRPTLTREKERELLAGA